MLGSGADRVAAVLALWHAECAAAGLPSAPGAEGPRTRRGAATLADEYLNAARLTWEQLQGGVRKLLEIRKSSSRCGMLDLGTLARNPDKYCPPPPVPKVVRKQERWRMVCDVCGFTVFTEWAAAGAPAPLAEGCSRVGERTGDFSFVTCQGTLEPAEREERER